jgi:16S rRNA (guanine527-N7)-methyltransferase
MAVPPDSARKLGEFESLLREQAIPLGLVAASDAARVWERHVLDSLRATAAVQDSDTLAYDIGSGAGLPGLVVALVRPRLHVVLVEPRRSRAAFLELAVQRLDVANASVHVGRIQDVHELGDVCFARAFAPLLDAWRAALPLLRPKGRLVFFAGAGIQVPTAVPEATAVRVLESPVLESAGPLIIMTR